MFEYLLRFIAGGLAVSAFAILGDALRPKSFAGLFGAAPSIALVTLLITLSQNGAHFAAVEGRSMIVGAFALAAYSWMVCLLLKKNQMSSWFATMVSMIAWIAVAFGLCAIFFGLLMIVRLNLSPLRETRWYEHAIRFVLGGAMTVIAGLIAARFGPVVGGLFLAFPAIFPASATLIEKHVRERKEKAGLAGARRGKEAAALDAVGAMLGSFGLAAFAAVIWLLIGRSPSLALLLATAAWLAVALLAWIVRRRL